MAPIPEKAAFFDVDNTLVRGSTLYFLGRGMYQRGFFTKADISRFVVANIRFRMTGTEKKEVIEKFQNAATDFIGGHAVEDIKKIGEEIYDEFVSPKIWQGTFEIAQSHLDKGEEVWLVTAAPQDMPEKIPVLLRRILNHSTDSRGRTIIRRSIKEESKMGGTKPFY